MGEWISFEEAQPDAGQDYIVYDAAYNQVTTDYWNELINQWAMAELVTHWMPLPDAPR